MLEYQEILRYAPFDVAKNEKEKLLTERLRGLSIMHYERCSAYRNIVNGLGCDLEKIRSFTELPFIPVSLFKSMDLMSIAREDIFKTMTSSGTSGQAVSRIFLDRQTAGNQQKTLVKIVSDFIGASRLPMLIIDSPSVIKDRKMFSARGAGVLGFSIFGADRTYALKDDMTIDMNAVTAFLEKHKGKPVLLFGFTFMIWQHFYKELEARDSYVDMSDGILIHGGGWKKLISESVSPTEFKERLLDRTGLRRIHDYYGMAEQTGSVYMECECGHLHASTYSDIVIRDYRDFSVCEVDESGIVQVVSMIPESYPGHSLLTEDEGVLLGEDDCPCGRKGKYFRINGRLQNAEIRGCSDTYASRF